jgi:hypothetical protein
VNWNGNGHLGGKLAALLNGVDLTAAAVSGAAAGVAYVAEMAVDLKTIDYRADDLHLLGGVFLRDRSAARRLGLLMHLGASAGLGLLYAALAHDRLPGPPWLRGVAFANVENAALYPLALLEDYHPAIRRGELDCYWHRAAFVQSVPRHVAYGAVAGALYERLRTRR